MFENIRSSVRAQLPLIHAELRANRRLQYGMAAIGLVIALNAALAWSERLDERQRQLTSIMSDIVKLRNQSRDANALQQTATEVSRVESSVTSRLWAVPSEAIGQARLRDWLNDALLVSGAQQAVVNLTDIAANTPTSPERASSNLNRTPNAGALAGPVLKELRGVVSFVFTPEALEQMLYRIEGGETFITVDTMTINRFERKAEIGLRCLVLVKPEDAK